MNHGAFDDEQAFAQEVTEAFNALELRDRHGRWRGGRTIDADAYTKERTRLSAQFRDIGTPRPGRADPGTASVDTAKNPLRARAFSSFVTNGAQPGSQDMSSEDAFNAAQRASDEDLMALGDDAFLTLFSRAAASGDSFDFHERLKGLGAKRKDRYSDRYTSNHFYLSAEQKLDGHAIEEFFTERLHPRGRGGKWTKGFGSAAAARADRAANVQRDAPSPTAAAVEKVKSEPHIATKAAQHTASAASAAAKTVKQESEHVSREQRLLLKTGIDARDRKKEFKARVAKLKPGEEMVLPGTHIHVKRAPGRAVKSYDVWDNQTPRGKRRIVGTGDVAQEVQERHQIHHDFRTEGGKHDVGTDRHAVAPEATKGEEAQRYEDGFAPKEATKFAARKEAHKIHGKANEEAEKVDQANPIPVADYGPEAFTTVLDKAGGAAGNPHLSALSAKVDSALVGKRAHDEEAASHGLHKGHGAAETVHHLVGRADVGTGVKRSAADHLAAAAPHVGHGRHRAALAQAARIAGEAGGHEHLATAGKLAGHVARSLLMGRYEEAKEMGDKALMEAIEDMLDENVVAVQTLAGQMANSQTQIHWDPAKHPRDRLGKFMQSLDSLLPGINAGGGAIDLYLPNGTGVWKSAFGGHFIVQTRDGKKMKFKQTMDAAKAALATGNYAVNQSERGKGDPGTDRPDEVVKARTDFMTKRPDPLDMAESLAGRVIANLQESDFNYKHPRGRGGKFADVPDKVVPQTGRTTGAVAGDDDYVSKLHTLPDFGKVTLHDGTTVTWVPHPRSSFVTGEYTDSDGYRVELPGSTGSETTAFVKNAEDVPNAVTKLRGKVANKVTAWHVPTPDHVNALMTVPSKHDHKHKHKHDHKKKKDQATAAPGRRKYNGVVFDEIANQKADFPFGGGPAQLPNGRKWSELIHAAVEEAAALGPFRR